MDIVLQGIEIHAEWHEIVFVILGITLIVRKDYKTMWDWIKSWNISK